MSETNEATYSMPAEELPHEGTWLTWPHEYTYGSAYRDELDPIWIAMTQALQVDENVHIIAYDQNEKVRIEKLLNAHSVPMERIDFTLAQSDDVWIRDTGPMFVFDKENKMVIANFGFDGWGKKTAYRNDDQIPVRVGEQKKMSVVDVSSFVLEGGSVEQDGNKTMMATLSSVVSENRNKNMTIKQAEAYLTRYLGVTNFIWLKGVINEDITDAHIDGMARFVDDKTLLTVSESDFSQLYDGIDMNDYDTLKQAKNINGQKYTLVEMPMTKHNVKGLDYKGSYLNYYISNGSVLVPAYGDENDALAVEIIKNMYPRKRIVPIVINNLYKHGGMIHCVTQQQPSLKSS